MTVHTIAIDFGVIPVVLVLVVIWCVIAAGIVRRLILLPWRLFDVRKSTEHFDLGIFVNETREVVRTKATKRAVRLLFYRPREGVLLWVALVLVGFIAMALWSCFIMSVAGILHENA